MNRLLLLLGGGGGGAVARVPSFVASCAPLLTPLGAPCASFLTAFCSPASPVLPPLCTGLRRICGRRRGRGRRRCGLGFRLRHRENYRRSNKTKRSGVSKESEYISTADLLWLQTFIHFCTPVCDPRSMSPNVESLALDPDQPGRTSCGANACNGASGKASGCRGCRRLLKCPDQLVR